MRLNLELSVWPDGTLRLGFWDTSNSRARLFTIADDGTATERRVVVTGDAPYEETVTPVNLAAALRELLTDMEAAYRKEERS